MFVKNQERQWLQVTTTLDGEKRSALLRMSPVRLQGVPQPGVTIQG